VGLAAASCCLTNLLTHPSLDNLESECCLRRTRRRRAPSC
jgi:hypothetical protein